MTELLPLSVGIGLFVGLTFTELFGLASGGLIVPGYLALYLTEPLTVALTLGGGLLTYGVVRALSTFLIVYGRRRGSSMMTQQLWQWAIILGVFGFIMPGINNWAHGGGFAAGWIAAQLMPLDDDRQDSSWVLLASLGFIAITILGVGLSFVRVTTILMG